ncbi:MAG: choice-of-anchor D domain-containing protein, partial [Candidatus Cloacimonadaceae bacterium]|nr:choice-of-anchor D domain-containing protein [Candidatus Cloacimonadaceae bacterium]
MKRAAIILAILLVGLVAMSAQITSYYSFSASTETYVTITGTNIPTAIGDNVMSSPVDIGFAFSYGTNSYSQVKVSSNGYVTLGTAPGSSPNNALVGSICPVLAPLWDDTYLQGSAQWLLSGTAPNRIFTIQYTSVKWPINTPTIFNYQVRLHEDSTIEFIYGPSVGTPTGASASIGINMLPGSYENFYSVTPGNPATASQSAENSTINIWPGANTKYVFSAPTQYPNDLAALSITGNQTPTSGVAYTYMVSVRNNGTVAQSNYSVKIMSVNVQLASVAGPPIAPQTTINVPISWTPSTTGLTLIEGRVDLTGDQAPNNNLSPPLEVFVQAAGTTALTIGDGSQSARKPVDISYLNSMFQTIFTAGEITLNGTITGVSFYNNFVDHRPNMPTRIWLGTTTQTNLSAGWIPAYQMVQVFNGVVNFPNGQNNIYISFNPATPFTYTGGNLVMMVQRPLDTVYYSSANQFFCQTVGTNRARHAASDATVFDPNNMGTLGTVSGQFPKTTLYVVPAANAPAFSVDPPSHNFGQVLINQASSQAFQVSNTGGGTLNISAISISGSPYFSLLGLPTLPVALNSGQTTSFSVQYLPTAAGQHTATLSITDDLARLVHTVALSGTGFDSTINTVPYTQNFDGVTAPSLPFGWQRITLGTATVTTVTNSPYSAPNSVLMNNSNSASGPYLVAPPISSTIPINTLRVR